MGTDIHWFVERYEPQAGIWVLLDGAIPFFEEEPTPLVYRGRNYELFAALAGIRGRVAARFPIRGLPTDVSPITAACSEVDADCIGHTWLSLAELQSLKSERFYDSAFASVVNGMEEAASLGPARAVFWFDT